MGQSSSKNKSENITRALIEVINTSTQECHPAVNQSQIVNVTGNKGAVINVGNISGRQVVALDLACFTRDTTFNNIEQNMKTLVEQQARALTDSLGIPGGSAKARNITQNVNNLAISILTAYRQTCALTVSQAQLVNISNNEGGVITTGDINWDQTFNGIANCIQQNETVNAAKQALELVIDQESTSQVTGLSSLMIWGIVIIGLILLIIIGVVLFLFLRPRSK